MLIYIAAFVVIVSSYFNKSAARIFMTILSICIYVSIVDSIKWLNITILPYFYVRIGNTEYNIVNSVIGLASLALIVWIAIKHFDNKLEIV